MLQYSDDGKPARVNLSTDTFQYHCQLKLCNVMSRLQTLLSNTGYAMNDCMFNSQLVNRIVILLLVGITLVGCGSVNRTTPVFCPGAHQPAPVTAFCLTPQEIAMGQSVAHVPGIPDSDFLKQNVSLTLNPKENSVISAT